MDLDVSLDGADSTDDHSQPGSCGSYPGCSTGGDGEPCPIIAYDPVLDTYVVPDCNY